VRVVKTVIAQLFVGPLAELIWRVRGPKWCRMPERSSLSMSVSEMRKAGIL
jgi:hypothetical protein